MRAPADLHPDDTTNRQQIAARLRATRHERGLSTRQLAVVLDYKERSAVGQMERKHDWRAATLQRWARSLGHRATFTIDSLAIPHDGDALAAAYRDILARPDASPEVIDRTQVRQVVNDMARIRRSLMTSAEFGQRLGLDRTSVLWRENNPDGITLSSMQQAARALGGRLLVGLSTASTTSATWSVAA